MKQWKLCILLAVWMTTPAWTAPAEYQFSVGDIIDVLVTPQTNFGKTVTVQPDGKIVYPVVGQIQAAGLTVAQLTEKLKEGLSRQLVNPEVTVSLKQITRPQSDRVSLLGAVVKPGAYDIKEGTTAAEALALAGGPAATADLRRVTITRADQSVQTIDLAQTDNGGRLVQNVVLRPGDLIMIAEGVRATVMVVGEVQKPGSYDLPKGARLLDALSLAGGPTPQADLRRVTLMRSAPGSSRSQSLDVQALLAAGTAADLEINIALQAGDALLIPQTDQRMYVMGAVQKPDLYAIKPGDRVLDVFVRAGQAPAGDITKAVLVRKEASGQPMPKPLDLKAMMETGDPKANELVQPGDLLYVPERKVRGPRTNPLGTILPLASLIRLFYGGW